MSQTDGFWKQLLHRRLPQIIGMYIAAMWMAVEMGDWITGKLGLPESISVQLFVAMAAMLPSVVIIAWFHGAPGKDRWTRVEKVSVPLNVAVAVLILALFRPPSSEATAMVEEKTLVDETGTEQVFEVASEGYHHRVAGFFWNNRGAEEDRWYAYAIPEILAEDLDRSPFIDFDSPYSILDSGSELAAAGYPDGTGVPLALQLKMARERLIPYLVDGDFDFSGETGALSARLYDVRTGRVEANFDLEGTDPLALLDQLAFQIRRTVVTARPRDASIYADLPIAEHFTASLEAIRHFVAARNAQFFDNAYQKALGELEKAIAIDPTFAAAHMRTVALQRLSGNNAAALASIDAALEVDYKLSSEDRFVLKAVRYALKQDTDKAIRVVEMWTEVHPNSAQAFRVLGDQYMITGKISGALEAYRRVYALDPTADQLLMRLAQLQIMAGAPDRAIEHVDRYIEKHPQDPDALLTRGGIYRRIGNFDAAMTDFERAAVLDSDDFEAELAIAELDARQRHFVSASARFAQLGQRSLTPQQRVNLGIAEIKLLLAQGRITTALERMEDLAATARKALPPIQEIFTVGTTRAMLQTRIGRIDAALATIDEIGTRVSPPFDGFLHLSRMMVHELSENRASYREDLQAFEAHAGSFGLPVLGAFVKAGHARVAIWEERYPEAQRLYREAISELRRSFLGTMDEQNVDQLNIYLAESVRKGGRPDQARAVLEQHLQRYPYDGMARVELARALVAADAKSEALDQLATVLEQWSEADDEYDMLAEARALRASLTETVAGG